MVVSKAVLTAEQLGQLRADSTAELTVAWMEYKMVVQTAVLSVVHLVVSLDSLKAELMVPLSVKLVEIR